MSSDGAKPLPESLRLESALLPEMVLRLALGLATDRAAEAIWPDRLPVACTWTLPVNVNGTITGTLKVPAAATGVAVGVGVATLGARFVELERVLAADVPRANPARAVTVATGVPSRLIAPLAAANLAPRAL
jgi:hypothetical protein